MLAWSVDELPISQLRVDPDGNWCSREGASPAEPRREQDPVPVADTKQQRSGTARSGQRGLSYSPRTVFLPEMAKASVPSNLRRRSARSSQGVKESQGC